MADERPVTLENRITLRGISIETTEISTGRDVFLDAREAGRLDHEYDVYLSDMDGRTVIVTPDGEVIDPHTGDEAMDLIDALEPVLELVPTDVLIQYVNRRTEGA